MTGTVGEEAGRLFEALQEAADAWSRGDAAGGRETDTDPSGRPAGDGHVPETCGICPVCKAIARLGKARPDVIAHLADATTALAAAVSALAADHNDHKGARTGPAGHEDVPRPTTEHIDVTD